MRKKDFVKEKAAKALGYSGMATALLAMAHEADAQVVYTDVDPDSVFIMEQFDVDFDGDGVVDISVNHGQVMTATSGGALLTVNKAAVEVPSGNAFLAENSGGYAYVAVLGMGNPIAPGNPNFGSASYGTCGGAYFGATSSFYGPWLGQMGYIGCKFQAGSGQTHFGWVQLEVPADCGWITLMGYAYESTPGTAIAAGDTGAVDQVGTWAHVVDFNAVPNPANDRIVLDLGAFGAGETTLCVTDATGRTCITRNIDGASAPYTLDLSDLAPGTYLIQARNGLRVGHRKVVKQ
ncbi:MAG TPA: T9SS type A sorting domain-containing protein [Flavobacteriales bacterium]|nr:T9SS type A sorting domain-containing protein [Flavobacteriales bacterium]